MKVVEDISDLLGCVRNQGFRDTCLAFATSAAHEVLQKIECKYLSVEWLFYNSIRYSSDPPTRGANLLSIANSICNHGQPYESFWPFNEYQDYSNWHPPGEPEVLFYANCELSTKVDIAMILRNLENGVPSVVTINIDQSFRNLRLLDNNAYVQCSEVSKNFGHHAVLITGYGILDDSIFLKMRNSWGENWGVKGYAWINENDLNKNGTSTLILRSLQ